MESQIEILVDLSSSMEDPLYEGVDNEEPKIEVTKKLLIEKVIPILDLNSKISIHTFNADGKDEEINMHTILDEEYTSKIDLTKRVKNIRNPDGWTPIAAAIDFSVERLKAKQSFDKKIILITDGKETCNGDYLESARQAAYSGVNCKIFIIGIGELTENAIEEFEEIAKITEGKFVNIGVKDQDKNEMEQKLQDLFKSISLDTIFNMIDSHYESDRSQNLILSKIFKDYQKMVVVIPNKIGFENKKQETLIVEFYDSRHDYSNLGKALNYIEESQGFIKNVIIVLNEWNQEKETVIRKYCPLLKELGVNKFDIKILGLPVTNPNFVKNIFSSHQNGNIVNIVGDNNFVNTGSIQKYDETQTEVLSRLIEVIKVVEENQTINHLERLKYVEQLNLLTKEILKEKRERLPKSTFDLILSALGPLDSMTTIWLNVKEILKSDFWK